MTSGPTFGISRSYHRGQARVRRWKCPRWACRQKQVTYSSSVRAPGCPRHRTPMERSR
jgi:hypothetical protein